MKEINRVLRAKPSDAGNAGESVGWQDPVGMDRPDLRSPTGECANASGCSGGVRVPATHSLVRSWPGQIRCARRSIKKTPQTDGWRTGTVDLSGLWTKCHFQQQGSPLPACGFRRKPRIPLSTIIRARKSVGYFAAVRLRDGKFLFRREIRKIQRRDLLGVPTKVFREVSAVPGRRILAISDNAQYHRSKLHLEWRDQQVSRVRLGLLARPIARI